MWIDLAAAFAQDGDPTRFPTLLDLSSRVPGTLLSWQKTKTGSWVAWVQMRVHRDPGPAYDRQNRTVTTAVPAAAVSPQNGAVARMNLSRSLAIGPVLVSIEPSLGEPA